VTNKQFKCFVDAGGYDQVRPWWTKKAIADITSWEKRTLASRATLLEQRQLEPQHPTRGGRKLARGQRLLRLADRAFTRHRHSDRQQEGGWLPTRAEWEPAPAATTGGPTPGAQTTSTRRAPIPRKAVWARRRRCTSTRTGDPGACVRYGRQCVGMDRRMLTTMHDMVKGGAWWNNAKGVGAAAPNHRGPRELERRLRDASGGRAHLSFRKGSDFRF